MLVLPATQPERFGFGACALDWGEPEPKRHTLTASIPAVPINNSPPR